MISKILITGICLMLMGGGFVGAEEETKQDNQQESTLVQDAPVADNEMVQGKDEAAPQEAAAPVVEVGNKICPVSSEKVGEMGDVVKYEYNGKIYNFCCSMCIKDFKKDPEKYSKIAEDEVKNVEGQEEQPKMEEAK